MSSLRSKEIAFKALIHDFAHELGVEFAKIHEVSHLKYLAYLYREYPADETWHPTSISSETVERWWDEEVGNIAWLENYHASQHGD